MNQNVDSDGGSDSEQESDQETLLDEEQILTGPEVSPALAAMLQKRIKEPTPAKVTTVVCLQSYRQRNHKLTAMKRQVQSVT